jgi:hypothetical protein
LAKRHPRRVWLPLVAVPTGFLVDSVNHYLRHAEHRAAIGTVEGHEQLVRAVAGGPDVRDAAPGSLEF